MTITTTRVSLPEALLVRELFSFADAVELGVRPGDLATAVRSRTLFRPRHGWYSSRIPRYVRDRHRLALSAVLLEDGDQLVASHSSAALLLDLPVRDASLRCLHLTWRASERRAQSRVGARIHQLPTGLGEPSGGMLPIALVCLQTATVDAASGLMAADAALRTGQFAAADLQESLTLLRGVRGCQAAGVVARIADGRRESPGESQLAMVLHQLGRQVEPQVVVVGACGARYRADFVLVGARVIVEYDGRDKYTGPEDLRAEKRREDDLRAVGWAFVRVTAEMLRDIPLLERELRRAEALAARQP